MREFKTVVSIETALARLHDALGEIASRSEMVPVDQALHRITAEHIRSKVNVPPVDRAAMDGFAVVARDTFGASQVEPVRLTVSGSVRIGETPSVEVEEGHACEIATGATMPVGADAVVMLEYSQRISNQFVEVHTSVAPGENVARKGEDVQTGDLVLPKGTRLRPHDIGALSMVGLRDVAVSARPRVALFSTGGELEELGFDANAAKVVDINRPIISQMIREIGASPIDLGIRGDDLDVIRDTIREGLSRAEAVVSTGGTSVGQGDLIPDAIYSLGKPGMVVHGIAMRPGMPTGLAVLGGKPVFLLSGYPVAAIVGFDIFVRPVLLRMLGARDEPRPIVRGTITRRLPGTLGMKTFVRVVVRRAGGELLVEPIRSAGSGVLSSMTKANGILVIPENIEGIEAGNKVEVALFRPVLGDGESAF